MIILLIAKDADIGLLSYRSQPRAFVVLESIEQAFCRGGIIERS
jgi:hypothetical protein